MVESTVKSSSELVVGLTEKELIRVLHVDDEAGFLKAAKQILEMQGAFEVDTTVSVEEAIEKMKEKAYDAIVCDYIMPRKDGLQFLKELRNSGNNTPFIIFTGKSREEVAIEALNLGADRYFSKIGDPETVYTELAHGICQAVERKRAVKEVWKREQRLRAILASSPEIITVSDLQGNIVDCNEAAWKLTGFSSKEELLGKSSFKFIAEKDRKKAMKNLKKTLEQGTKRNIEYTFLRKNGEEYTGELSASILKDPSGNPTSFVCVVRDITERKKAEQTLHESQEKFERLFISNPEAAVYTDHDFHILGINPRFTELFGYSLDEVKGKHINEVVVPKGKVEEAEMFDKKAGKGGTYQEDTVRKRKDGSLVQVSFSAAPIIVENRVIGQVIVYKDISQLKRTQRELEESRRHFRMLFNVMVDPVVVVDGKGTILEVSKSLEELSGYRREELVGKNFLKVKGLTAKSKTVAMKNLAKRMMGMHTHPYPVEAVTKDGKKLSVEVNAAKIMYKGKPVDMVVFRDLTQRKKMEEKLRVVGRLTRHDVRNKLSAVTGNVYLMKKKLGDDSEALEWLGQIESAVDEATKIFDFARTYEKLGMEELDYMDVEKTFEEAVQLHSDLKGVEVVNDCRGLKVLADSLLRQLFYNLIDNSLKHGEKVSRIKVYYEEKGKDQLKLVYEDDGVGTPKAEKEKIFMEGYGKSSGYGLYLIKKMCEVYGWTIEETGRHGEGAEFSITIPKVGENGEENYRC